MRQATALFVVALTVAAAQVPDTVAWRNGAWFDGNGFRRLDVYSIGERLTFKNPSRIDRTVDLSGKFVTGAFGEAHNHNIPSVDTAGMIRTYMEQGIFYVMNQTNSPEAAAKLRGLINRPDSVEVLFAHGSFTAPGGHPTALVRRNVANGSMTREDLDGGFLQPVGSRQDIDRVWNMRIRRQQPDFIKLTLVYSEDRVAGVPRPESDRHGLEPSLTSYLVRRAHADGLRVSAHVESAYDFEVAVAARVDLVAHLPGFWPDPDRIKSKGTRIYQISEDAARRAGRQGVVVITTVGEVLRMNATPEERRQIVDVLRWNFDVLKRHGVRIAIGSDQYQSTSVPEALTIVQAGLMTAPEALQSLSVTTPAAIFPQRAFGLVEGAPASFIAIDQNPLEDLESITRISLRVKQGREQHRAH